jgi:putative ABC transport system permease protein
MGDQILIGPRAQARSFTVVGTTVLPPIGSNSADSMVLGGGVLLTMDGLVKALQIDAGTKGSSVVVDLAPGADAAAFVTLVNDEVAADHLPGSVTAVGPGLPYQTGSPIEPSEVIAYRKVRTTPTLLATVLSVLAAATVSHALALSVRRRRRAFGILRALGFTGAQVRATVAWHATIVAVIAALVGIPAGVITGRAAWSLVADQLGVVNTTVVPWMVVVFTAALAVLAANAVAALPAHRAARASAAAALRDE